MKKTILFIGTLMVLANACVKEADNNETYRPAGTPIVFGAATGYENGDGTRTIYSGDLYGTTNQYERIDWVANDPIKVYYGTDNGVYTVNGSSITAASENSNAGVTFSSGTQLTWSSQSNHLFYAVYPSSATLNAAGHVSGSIPATQTVTYNSTKGKYLPDMSHAYLVSRKTITSSSTESTVNLPFTPAYTAFEFNLTKPGTAAITVTKLELISSGNLVGTFAFDIDGENAKGATWSVAPTVTGAGTTATVNIPGGKVLSAATDVLNVTVLALPVDITGLTVKLTMASGDVLSLPLKDNATTFHTFTACRKYVISNSNIPSQWTYTVEPIADYTGYGHDAMQYAFGVRSYRTDMNGNTQAVTWKAQYSTDGVNWTDTPPAGSSIEDFTVTTATGNGVAGPAATPETRSVDLVANTHYTQLETHTSTEILRSRPAVSNYDLSLHDVHGGTISQSTANTYVVSAPGTYLFPCVYGNAIKNGATNTPAFNPAGSTEVWKPGATLNGVSAPQYNQLYAIAFNYGDVNLLPVFRNVYNTGIQNPYVVEDLNGNSVISSTVTGLNAAVVWQDEEIIPSSATQPSLITVNGHQYIQFTIDQNNIKPGNIVIALRGGIGVLGANTILWSWQIWVTEKDLHAVNGLMPYNLGWNVDGDIQTRQYTDRECYVRIQQLIPADDPTGAVDNEDFFVEQLGDSEELLQRNIGSSPYYQWGRKDPLLPGQYSATLNEIGEHNKDKTIYAGSGYTVNHNTQSPGTETEYGKGIRHPEIGYIHDGSPYSATGWVGGPVPIVGGSLTDRQSSAIAYNLWDASMISSPGGAGDNGAYKTKTVYDPCPVGFTVPYQSKFAGFVGSGNAGAGDGGRTFGGVFMPYLGARIFYNIADWTYGDYTQGQAITPALYLRHVNEFGLYWTDAPYNTTALMNEYMYARIFAFVQNNATIQQYTRGSAASIRPMVDPRF